MIKKDLQDYRLCSGELMHINHPMVIELTDLLTSMAIRSAGKKPVKFSKCCGTLCTYTGRKPGYHAHNGPLYTLKHILHHYGASTHPCWINFFREANLVQGEWIIFPYLDGFCRGPEIALKHQRLELSMSMLIKRIYQKPSVSKDDYLLAQDSNKKIIRILPGN